MKQIEQQTERICSGDLPSCEAIGLQAKNNRNFKLARQMFHTALKQLEGKRDDYRSIHLMVCIGETYLDEGFYRQAEAWFEKAVYCCEVGTGIHTFRAACIMTKLAQVYALTGEETEFSAIINRILRAYLLSKDTNLSLLLDGLIDLSWSLCINGQIKEVRQVNYLIAQIKQLDEEEQIASVAV